MEGIQLQTVLYENQPEDLMRSALSWKTALEGCRRKGMEIRGELLWGDASGKPLDKAFLKDVEEALQGSLDFTYVCFRENTGTSRGHNRLFPMGKGQYVLTMNPDLLASPDTLAELLGAFRDEKTGMVEARQIPLEHPKAYDPADRKISWASGACTLIRRACFEALRGYDEHFFMYCDDVDLSWRARLAGWEILCCPEAVVYHGHDLDSLGRMRVTPADRRYSPEAEMMLMQRYAWPDALEERKNQLRASSVPEEQEALKSFLDRDPSWTEIMDREHRVSHFPLYTGEASRFRPEDRISMDPAMPVYGYRHS